MRPLIPTKHTCPCHIEFSSGTAKRHGRLMRTFSAMLVAAFLPIGACAQNSTPATIQPLDTSATVVGGVNSGAPVTAVISNMGVASISTAGATLELQCQILSYTAGLTILPTGVYLTGASWLVATPISK